MACQIVARLPLHEGDQRTTEMIKCLSVDKDNFSTYCAVEDFFHSVTADRYFRFVIRHNLKEQLHREDAQGIR
jgi:hypothetical protein